MFADRAEQKEGLKQLKLQLTHVLKAENDWRLFKMYFEEINKNFIPDVTAFKAGLTENEVRLCVLIKYESERDCVGAEYFAQQRKKCPPSSPDKIELGT